MAFLTPNRIRTVEVAGKPLTILSKIIPDDLVATKYVASYVQPGQKMKPCAKLAGTGTPKGITIHNTEDIVAATGTNAAEQYCRATYNGNMGGVVPHFYVWQDQVWQLLDETEQGWHAADGATRRSAQRPGETIGGNLDTLAIEGIGADPATEETVALLTAHLLQQHGLDPATDIYTHQYFYPAKYCPAYILPHWGDFVATVAAFYGAGVGDGTGEGAATDDKDAQIAELEAEIAQLQADYAWLEQDHRVMEQRAVEAEGQRDAYRAKLGQIAELVRI